MVNGFDTSELEQYEKDLIKLALDTMNKQSKKFLKKEAKALSKEQKNEIKTLGIGDQGITEKEILASSKSGKVYNYDGNLTCRAFNSHPLAHLLDQGFLHKGGKNHDGVETFVVGYKFIDKAQKGFETGYYKDVQDFIDKMLEDGLN